MKDAVTDFLWNDIKEMIILPEYQIRSLYIYDSQIMCLANQKAFDWFAVCQSFWLSIYGKPEAATGPRKYTKKKCLKTDVELVLLLLGR